MNKICNGFLSFGLVIQHFLLAQFFKSYLCRKPSISLVLSNLQHPLHLPFNYVLTEGSLIYMTKVGRLATKKDRRGTSRLR